MKQKAELKYFLFFFIFLEKFGMYEIQNRRINWAPSETGGKTTEEK